MLKSTLFHSERFWIHIRVALWHRVFLLPIFHRTWFPSSSYFRSFKRAVAALFLERNWIIYSFSYPLFIFKISPAGFMISLEYSILTEKPLSLKGARQAYRDLFCNLGWLFSALFSFILFSLSEEEKGAVFWLSSDSFTTKFTNFYYLIKMKYPSFLHLPKFFLTIQYL